MARENPRKALAALLPLPLSCGDYEGAPVVRPMTLGMWAALERIGSPLVTGEEPKDVMDLIPSLYLITHDPREVFAGNVLDAAMRWADTLPVGALDMIREAAYRQMNAAFDVIPEEGESKKKKDRRVARLPRAMVRRDLRVELRRNPLGCPALGGLPLQAVGRTEGRQDNAAAGGRGD